LDSIDAGLDADCGTYVHCWGGSGRTGTAIGCWLRRHELATPDDVIELMNRLRDGDLGGGLKPTPNTPEQAAFIRAWPEGA
ncbi:MAG: protein phosphatase, partial [Actinomycetia bacterium]|nr:protein phosphatase [Actinomycetes bacterium]